MFHYSPCSWVQTRPPRKPPRAGVTNLFENESYFLVQIHAKGYQFGTHTSEIKICSVCLQLSYQKKLDIHPCQDIEHVYDFVRTSPRATHIFRLVDLVHHVGDPCPRVFSRRPWFKGLKRVFPLADNSLSTKTATQHGWYSETDLCYGYDFVKSIQSYQIQT